MSTFQLTQLLAWRLLWLHTLETCSLGFGGTKTRLVPTVSSKFSAETPERPAGVLGRSTTLNNIQQHAAFYTVHNPFWWSASCLPCAGFVLFTRRSFLLCCERRDNKKLSGKKIVSSEFNQKKSVNRLLCLSETTLTATPPGHFWFFGSGIHKALKLVNNKHRVYLYLSSGKK